MLFIPPFVREVKQGLKQMATTMSEMLMIPTYSFDFLSRTGTERIFFELRIFRVSSTVVVVSTETMSGLPFTTSARVILLKNS